MSRLLILAALCIALAGCASTPTPAASPVAGSQEGEPGDALARMLRTGVAFDFEPTDSPADAAAKADLVVVGTVRDIVDGRTLPYGRANRQANLVVSVETVVKGDAGDTIYVEVPKPTDVSIEKLRAATPTRRVMLFLGDRTHMEASGAETGRPAGSPIYTPFVDGFVIESKAGWTSGLVSRDEVEWTSSLSTFDEVVAASR